MTGIGSYFFTPREEGLLVVTATFKGNDFTRVVAAVDEETKRLVRDGPLAWELEKAKNMIKASYIYGAETAQGRARQMGISRPSRMIPDYRKISQGNRQGHRLMCRRCSNIYLVGRQKSLAALLPKGARIPVHKLENGLTYTVNKNIASPSLALPDRLYRRGQGRSPGQERHLQRPLQDAHERHKDKECGSHSKGD